MKIQKLIPVFSDPGDGYTCDTPCRYDPAVDFTTLDPLTPCNSLAVEFVKDGFDANVLMVNFLDVNHVELIGNKVVTGKVPLPKDSRKYAVLDIRDARNVVMNSACQAARYICDEITVSKKWGKDQLTVNVDVGGKRSAAQGRTEEMAIEKMAEFIVECVDRMVLSDNSARVNPAQILTDGYVLAYYLLGGRKVDALMAFIAKNFQP